MASEVKLIQLNHVYTFITMHKYYNTDILNEKYLERHMKYQSYTWILIFDTANKLKGSEI